MPDRFENAVEGSLLVAKAFRVANAGAVIARTAPLPVLGGDDPTTVPLDLDDLTVSITVDPSQALWVVRVGVHLVAVDEGVGLAVFGRKAVVVLEGVITDPLALGVGLEAMVDGRQVRRTTPPHIDSNADAHSQTHISPDKQTYSSTHQSSNPPFYHQAHARSDSTAHA